VTRHGISLSLHQIEERLADRQEELDHTAELAEAAQKRHEATLERMRQERKELRAELGQLRQEQELLGQIEAPREVKIVARRQQVLTLLEDGKTEDEIAAQVGVSVRTVQRDLAAISVNGREHENE
jgi:DNA-binding NarL/FixJ family response regulator